MYPNTQNKKTLLIVTADAPHESVTYKASPYYLFQALQKMLAIPAFLKNVAIGTL